MSETRLYPDHTKRVTFEFEDDILTFEFDVGVEGITYKRLFVNYLEPYSENREYIGGSEEVIEYMNKRKGLALAFIDNLFKVMFRKALAES